MIKLFNKRRSGWRGTYEIIASYSGYHRLPDWSLSVVLSVNWKERRILGFGNYNSYSTLHYNHYSLAIPYVCMFHFCKWKRRQ